MAEYSYIKTSFWTDPVVEELSAVAKLVFIYLFSSPFRRQSGIYQVSKKRIGYDTGLSTEEVDRALTELEANGFIKWDNNQSVVWIVNFVRHQANKSPKVWKRIKRDLEEIGEHKFVEEFKGYYAEFLDIEESKNEVEDEGKVKGENKKESSMDVKNEDVWKVLKDKIPVQAREVVEYFLMKTGRSVESFGEGELSAIDLLIQKHTPAVIQKAINQALSRKRFKEDKSKLDFVYIWEMLKNWSSLNKKGVKKNGQRYTPSFEYEE